MSDTEPLILKNRKEDNVIVMYLGPTGTGFWMTAPCI